MIPSTISHNRLLSSALATILVVAVSLLFPGDAPWINDEPRLISQALHFNQNGRIADLGLMGSAGVRYGPLPIWMYQLLLAISHDPIVVTILHAALIMSATALALWWLARTLRLWSWFVPIVLLSPYLWFYSRLLWDNPFCIPLGALAVAGYAHWLERDSTASLAVALAASIGLLLTHLMSLALVLPLVAHALFFRRQEIGRHRLTALAVLAIGVAAGWRYGRYLSAFTSGQFEGVSWDGFIFPLLGGRVLTAYGLEYFFGTQALDAGAASWIVAAAMWISSVGYALLWGGIVIAAVTVVRAMRAGPASARDHLAGIALAVWLTQIAVDGFGRKFFHPHYYNATWIALVLLAWLAIDAIVTRPWGFVVPLAQAVSLSGMLAFLIVGLHRSGGTRELYGPTLANQWAVARALARYGPESTISIDVIHYQRYPHALAALRELVTPGADVAAGRPLSIRYPTSDPRQGWIEVVER